MVGEIIIIIIVNGINWYFYEKVNDNVNWWKKYF